MVVLPAALGCTTIMAGTAPSARKECMNTDLAVVLALLVGSMVLFIRNKPRMDVVALLVIVALPLSGVLTIQEAVAGFSDPNVLLIAALFVIGDGLVRTGIAYKLGDWMARQAGSSETRLIVLLMLTVAGLRSEEHTSELQSREN